MPNAEFQRLVLQCLRAVRNTGACNSQAFEAGYYAIAVALQTEDDAANRTCPRASSMKGRRVRRTHK